MELVIAAVGLSIGVLTPPMFAITVLIAATTTLTAAPMLKYCATREEEEEGGLVQRSAQPEPSTG